MNETTNTIEITDFDSTQFSGISTEWSDFNKEIGSVIQAWDNYLFNYKLSKNINQI